ncbi:hypothetical protein AALA52_06970 [Lactococcus ileimucosae]|uniref:Uncharacterized protein n=1 Tax=Lactococcus ileimucosae TaxID=2941329 RepID=A0ABV4D399_9LACT
MRKTLLNASFEESKQITPNFLDSPPMSYNLGIADSMKFFDRVVLCFPLLMLVGVSYAIGVGLPEMAAEGTAGYGMDEIWLGTTYFMFLKEVLNIFIISLTTVLLINIFPKKNYAIQRSFAALILFLLMATSCISLAPMLLGNTLGAAGWFGFSIIVAWGLGALIFSIHKKIRTVKNDLYKNDYGQDGVDKKSRKILQRSLFIVMIISVINIFTIKFGLQGNFTLWRLVWIFAGPLYFLLINLFITGPFRIYLSAYYLLKYSEQYRKSWKVLDEQWYGKRKARKLSNKELKGEK